MADFNEFEEEDYSNKKPDLETYKYIVKTILKRKGNVITLILSVISLALLDVCYPLLNAYAISHYFNPDLGDSRFDNVGMFILMYALVAIAYGVIIFLFIFSASKVEANTSYDLRKAAYEKLQQLPFSYFDATPQGWIMARMTSDSRKLSSILSWGCVDLLWGALTMTGILVMLLVINWKLALILLVTAPILGAISVIIRKKILVSYRNARKENSKITAAYNEGFMGNKTTKSLGIEEDNSNDFNDISKKYYKSSVRAVLFSSMFGPAIYLIGYVGLASTLYAGGVMVLDQIIEVATLYLFIDYTIKFFDPVTQISNILAEFQQAQASAERVVSLINTIPEMTDTEEVINKYGTILNPKPENYEDIVGDVEFKDVTFKYNKGQKVLNNFNLTVKNGQSIALVGHTGSGKSTLVNLICRFYEPTEGTILIDGKDYKERSIGWLHSKLGYVLQSPELFSGTIKENIKYGKLDATDEEVIEACKIVNAHDFISKLDLGYDYVVGEGGNKLSLGEKQLISFARAIVSNPRILILDEATSSIDTQTEYLIQEAINNVMKDRTTFMIAHRLSTVVNADRILVMKNGEIFESGTHKELLELKGYYFELYKNQFLQELEKKGL